MGKEKNKPKGKKEPVVIEDLDDEDYITLEFDDGESIECEIIGIFEMEGKEYIALASTEEGDEMFIFGYKEIDDEEFELIDIEDEDEFERAAKAFEELSSEEEDDE